MRAENKRKLKCQLWGWLLFVGCALLFIVSSAVNRDVIALAGSIVFLLACVLFLIPLLDDLKNYNRR